MNKKERENERKKNEIKSLIKSMKGASDYFKEDYNLKIKYKKISYYLEEYLKIVSGGKIDDNIGNNNI